MAELSTCVMDNNLSIERILATAKAQGLDESEVIKLGRNVSEAASNLESNIEAHQDQLSTMQALGASYVLAGVLAGTSLGDVPR